MEHSLIAGCGSVGLALAERLRARRQEVWAIRRRTEALPDNLHAIRGDLTRLDWAGQLPSRLDFVYYLASSDGRTEESYRKAYLEGPRNLLQILASRQISPRRFFFISSTGVYAQRSGEWVDETSPTEPEHFAGQILLAGESAVLESDLAATVVRLSGIYGPGRTRLLQRVANGQEACVEGLPLYTNRIHRDDCAGILSHLSSLDSCDELYLGVDHEPVDRCRLLRWLAGQLSAPPPGTIPPAESSPRTLRSNKRCSNRKILATGYRFRYPSFREGYAPLIQEWRSR